MARESFVCPDDVVERLFRTYPFGIIRSMGTITEGLSGATVVLVHIKRASDQDYDGMAFAKIDRDRTTREEFRRHLQALTSTTRSFIPSTLSDVVGPVDGWSMVLYRPAQDALADAQSLAQLIKQEFPSDQLAVQIRHFLLALSQSWHDPVLLHSTEQPRPIPELVRMMFDRGRTPRIAELADRLRQNELPGREHPILQFMPGNLVLPNPFAVLFDQANWCQEDGTYRRIVTPVSASQGDLHGGNLICRRTRQGKLTPNGSLWVIDLAQFEEEQLPFFDLAYLELDLLLRWLPAGNESDWGDWTRITEHLSSGLTPKGRPGGKGTAAAWATVRPIREHLVKLFPSSTSSDTLREQYEQAWWLAGATVGALVARRRKVEPAGQRIGALLYGARCLEQFLSYSSGSSNTIWSQDVPCHIWWPPSRPTSQLNQATDLLVNRPLTHASSPLSPTSYIPFARNSIFQARPGEFERLEATLFAKGSWNGPMCLALIGVVGMGGVGKTQLAVEVAHRYKERFPAGVFWMTATGTDHESWQRQLAELAERAGWLPLGDDPSHPENEKRRARHIAQYLAGHSECLLILDNVDDPSAISNILPSIAGQELSCTIIYSSRNTRLPPGTHVHHVVPLATEGALRLLLGTTRPRLLQLVLSGTRGTEESAALSLCHAVGNLPLGLIHLRSLLARDANLQLATLSQAVHERGVLQTSTLRNQEEPSLFASFHLSWEQVQEQSMQEIFLLACYFPEAYSVPLWLLGVASGLGESESIIDPLGEARTLLQELSLFEPLLTGYIRLHPLVREFGRVLLAQDERRASLLSARAGLALSGEVETLEKIEARLASTGYWRCLAQFRAMHELAVWIGADCSEKIKRVEHWLNRESHLLDKKLARMLPDLAYQQLFNRALEEGQPFQEIDGGRTRHWIRQLSPIGVTNREEVRTFAGHASGVRCVAFSPSGDFVLTGSTDSHAMLWHKESGQLLVAYEGHTGAISAVGFSSRASAIITGSLDRTACVWDMASGTKVTTLVGHEGAVSCVALSEDGLRALTGSYDHKAILWDTFSGQPLTRFVGHQAGIKSVAFSPDGATVLTGSYDGTARLWDIRSGEPVGELRISNIPLGIQSVAYSSDGKQIVACSPEHAVVWDSCSRERLLEIGDLRDEIRTTAMSPTGDFIITGSADGTATLWDKTTGQPLTRFVGHRAQISSVAFSPDGATVLTGSYDGTARLWDIRSGEPVNGSHRQRNRVNCVAFSPDGTRMFSVSEDKAISIGNTAGSPNSTLTFQSPDPYEVVRISCSPDGSILLTGSMFGIPRLWDSNNGNCLHALGNRNVQVMDIAFSLDSKRAVTAEGKSAKIWEVQTGTKLVAIPHSHDVFSVALSPEGTIVATGTFVGTVRLWNSATGTRLRTLIGHKGWTKCIAFSPDGKTLLTCSLDSTAMLWDVTSGERLCTLWGHAAAVEHVGFSPKGNIAVTCDVVGRVMFWDTGEKQRGRLCGVYTAENPVLAMCWIANDRLLLSDYGGPRGEPYIYRLKLENI